MAYWFLCTTCSSCSCLFYYRVGPQLFLLEDALYQGLLCAQYCLLDGLRKCFRTNWVLLNHICYGPINYLFLFLQLFSWKHAFNLAYINLCMSISRTNELSSSNGCFKLSLMSHSWYSEIFGKILFNWRRFRCNLWNGKSCL